MEACPGSIVVAMKGIGRERVRWGRSPALESLTSSRMLELMVEELDRSDWGSKDQAGAFVVVVLQYDGSRRCQNAEVQH